MASATAKHQHRHYKTLILLVLSMTGGTLLLLWLARFSPVTPLAATRSWTDITLRTEPGVNPNGFYHLRIDSEGRLFQSNAWKERTPDPDRPRTIHLLVTSASPSGLATDVQADTLRRTLADLGKLYSIPGDRVRVEAAGVVASLEGGTNRAALTGS